MIWGRWWLWQAGKVESVLHMEDRHHVAMVMPSSVWISPEDLSLLPQGDAARTPVLRNTPRCQRGFGWSDGPALVAHVFWSLFTCAGWGGGCCMLIISPWLPQAWWWTVLQVCPLLGHSQPRCPKQSSTPEMLKVGWKYVCDHVLHRVSENPNKETSPRWSHPA